MRERLKEILRQQRRKLDSDEMDHFVDFCFRAVVCHKHAVANYTMAEPQKRMMGRSRTQAAQFFFREALGVKSSSNLGIESISIDSFGVACASIERIGFQAQREELHGTCSDFAVNVGAVPRENFDSMDGRKEPAMLEFERGALNFEGDRSAASSSPGAGVPSTKTVQLPVLLRQVGAESSVRSKVPSPTSLDSTPLESRKQALQQMRQQFEEFAEREAARDLRLQEAREALEAMDGRMQKLEDEACHRFDATKKELEDALMDEFARRSEELAQVCQDWWRKLRVAEQAREDAELARARFEHAAERIERLQEALFSVETNQANNSMELNGCMAELTALKRCKLPAAAPRR